MKKKKELGKPFIDNSKLNKITPIFFVKILQSQNNSKLWKFYIKTTQELLINTTHFFLEGGGGGANDVKFCAMLETAGTDKPGYMYIVQFLEEIKCVHED